MVITTQYSITSPPDSPPMAQHWEGGSPSVKDNMVGKSGRLAPRWVHDLLHSDLDCGSFASIEWDRQARCSNLSVPHQLVLVGNQSTAEGRNPGLLSCVCSTCDFHFIIRPSWDADQLVRLCRPQPIHFPPKQTDYYLHHLVNINQSPQNTPSTAHYHPLIQKSLIAVEHFACSAPKCTYQVTVEISRPRLKREWVQLLLDKQRILNNLSRARKESPERFADARDDWSNSAPSTLNTYLRDLLDKPNPRNISLRNKRFQVVFGQECHPIFKAMQFEEQNVEKDGVFEPYFVPPLLEPGTPGTPTELNTLRAFVEDLQAEAESLIIRSGKPGENRPYVGNRLLKDLQCFEYPQSRVAPVASEAHRVLGVLPDFDKALIFYAYNRQSVLCEKRRASYVNALREIASQTSDDDFQTRAIQELTMVERQPTEDVHGSGDDLEMQAYSFFSLKSTATDDAVISAFNTKLEHSPSQADFAREMLLFIGRHRTSQRIIDHANGPMDVQTAYRILEASPEGDDEHISMMASVKLNENPKNKAIGEQTLNALEAIGNHRNSDRLRQEALSFKADLERILGQPPSLGLGFANTVGQSSDNVKPRLDLPVGLENIGNTCYLNSILQYLNTVVPVKDLLAHYTDYELGLDDSDISKRLLGGNKIRMDRAEAVVARVFVEELRQLLNDLSNTKQAAIRPSQRLANAALLPTTDLATGPDAESSGKFPEEQKTLEVMGAHFPAPPPPLPARPAPVPPAQGADHVDDIDMVNVTVDPVSGPASSVSSQTLVSFPDVDYERKDSVHEGETDISTVPDEPAAPVSINDDDVKMAGVETPVQDVEQRVLKALETQKRSSGTDQQDVEEVMGRFINRLQAAIKPTEIDEKDGIQWEPVMRTFYVELTNHTKHPNKDDFKVDSTLERAITAYPASGGPSTIYEGLNRNFDLQTVERDGKDALMRFTSIKNLPPILHVLIQRTKSDGRKNMNPVEVSEVLYLDRYMYTPQDGHLFKLRQNGWALQHRLEELNDMPKTTVEEAQNIDNFVDDFVNVEKEDAEEPSSLLADQPTSSLSFAGEEASFPAYPPPLETTLGDQEPPKTASKASAGRQKLSDMREEEIKYHQTELEQLFSQHKKQAYRLHAVVCHSGQLSAGHYWVWIHDFEAGIWRKYNDRTVTEDASTEDVLKRLNSNGDPYYLCYVKDGEERKWVKVPKRNIPSDEYHRDKDADGDIDLTAVDAAPVNRDSNTLPEGLER
ncbi:Ubiquitin carboxyl-terminal hydrolase 2-like protein 2 [Colletotrichum chlorophyti]|uniref:ubiquitinyl hydrolase 1 n=1 Tax=Colletotrichum chlorophyti TaxID=708187 RepID=A0A1Q8RWS6_9PEZI|nr:Ubiquitin carboxyl-terminal hydrolase 2-like protein 2 [Colletotrichum chlorophyti]